MTNEIVYDAVCAAETAHGGGDFMGAEIQKELVGLRRAILTLGASVEARVDQALESFLELKGVWGQKQGSLREVKK